MLTEREPKLEWVSLVVGLGGVSIVLWTATDYWQVTTAFFAGSLIQIFLGSVFERDMHRAREALRRARDGAEAAK